MGLFWWRDVHMNRAELDKETQELKSTKEVTKARELLIPEIIDDYFDLIDEINDPRKK